MKGLRPLGFGSQYRLNMEKFEHIRFGGSNCAVYMTATVAKV